MSKQADNPQTPQNAATEPHNARWMNWQPQAETPFYVCSHCGHGALYYPHTGRPFLSDYCPSCGYAMSEEMDV